MEEEAVRNVADKEKINESAAKIKRKRTLELDDLRRILDTDFGRRFVWRLLSRARVFETIWEPSAKIHYNAGQQDFGHFIMAELVECKPDALVQMMNEAKKGDLTW